MIHGQKQKDGCQLMNDTPKFPRMPSTTADCDRSVVDNTNKVEANDENEVINVNVSSHLSTVERDIIDILTSNPGVSRSILLNSLMQQNEEIKLTMSVSMINNTTTIGIQNYLNEQLEKMKREEKIIIIDDVNDNNNSKLYLKIN